FLEEIICSQLRSRGFFSAETGMEEKVPLKTFRGEGKYPPPP
ncbi:hypothetical protein A2U01_0031376, partial [Trifolium medium]|nr:hypothetical protein [Trifolium medium]